MILSISCEPVSIYTGRILPIEIGNSQGGCVVNKQLLKLAGITSKVDKNCFLLPQENSLNLESSVRVRKSHTVSIIESAELLLPNQFCTLTNVCNLPGV